MLARLSEENEEEPTIEELIESVATLDFDDEGLEFGAGGGGDAGAPQSDGGGGDAAPQSAPIVLYRCLNNDKESKNIPKTYLIGSKNR